MPTPALILVPAGKRAQHRAEPRAHMRILRTPVILTMLGGLLLLATQLFGGHANTAAELENTAAHARALHNAAQTADSAKRSHQDTPGHCLQWARTRAGIPGRYATAAEAARGAFNKHFGGRPPAGAAVYYTGGSHGYGHIAISVGGGKVRSTDSGGSGRVATVGYRWPVTHWHLHYAGWADNINGYTIPGV
ncbi:MAG: hypothetical protein ACXVEQ_17080 [Nocardioidaceae bacterium]